MSDPAKGMLAENASFLIASSKLDLLGEINWPMCRNSDTVIVQMNESTRKSRPLTDYCKQQFSLYY